MRRFLFLIVGVPAAILLTALAVVNRHPVQLVLDPFRPESPALALVLPFSAYLFIALFAGVAVGGFAAWAGQGRWRRAARLRAGEAARWRAEADRLARERDMAVGERKSLAVAGR